jgi:hypothetical protein
MSILPPHCRGLREWGRVTVINSSLQLFSSVLLDIARAEADNLN